MGRTEVIALGFHGFLVSSRVPINNQRFKCWFPRGNIYFSCQMTELYLVIKQTFMTCPLGNNILTPLWWQDARSTCRRFMFFMNCVQLKHIYSCKKSYRNLLILIHLRVVFWWKFLVNFILHLFYLIILYLLCGRCPIVAATYLIGLGVWAVIALVN